MASGAAGDIEEAVQDKLATPLDLNTAVRTEEVTVQFENNSQTNTDLRNVRPGNGSVTFSKGRFVVETAASGTSTQALETGAIGEYAAGLVAGVGLEVRKDTDPTGFAEWGYGGDAFNNEFRWRLRSDGTYVFERETGGTVTDIPRDLWGEDVDRAPVTDKNDNPTGVVTGFDKLDGDGPSQSDISTPVLGLFGVDFVLYGGGGFAPWFVDLTTREQLEKIYPFVFHPTDENVLEQFNQPVFARLDNDGTATADSIEVTERQFTRFGSNEGPERATQHCFDLAKTAAGPTCLVGVRRANAGGGTRVDILNTLLAPDSNTHIYYLVNPTVTANGEDANWNLPNKDFAGNSPDPSETRVEVNEALEVDATTGVALDGGIVNGGNKNNVVAETTDFFSSPFIRDRPVAVMIEPFAGAADVTSQEGVLNLNEAF